MWYWKHISHYPPVYILLNVDTGEEHTFKTYGELYKFCVIWNIDAKQG